MPDNCENHLPGVEYDEPDHIPVSCSYFIVIDSGLASRETNIPYAFSFPVSDWNPRCRTLHTVRLCIRDIDAVEATVQERGR